MPGTPRDNVRAAILYREDYPRVSLVIQDGDPPFSFVVIEGTVTVSEEPTELRHWAGRLGGRYMGADQAEAYAARNGVPGELLIRVTPRHVTAERDIAVYESGTVTE